MDTEHLEFLVEEPSTEAFVRALLPRLLPDHCTFDVHAFQGKDDLLQKLPSRLRGYARWLPLGWRIIVLVDRDDDECQVLKRQLDSMTLAAGLQTRTAAGAANWQVVNRLAIEELEAWYFGNWPAVRSVYPRVAHTIPAHAGYRDPDTISGGAWEAFERILKRHGYFKTGLRKIEAARAIGAHIDPVNSSSHSFRKFVEAIHEGVR
ncbi:MAG: DUF4276 family protein [Caldilineaceae bacterium]|nr:DUF4276 family protein [Caldilineaceae bacterium]